MFEPGDFGIGRLFERIRDAVVVADASNEEIVLWNKAAEALLGYTPAEALDIPLYALVPDELKDRHRAGIARFQETGTGDLISSHTPLELTAVHQRGYEVPVELTLSPVDQVGDKRYVLAILRDRTDRRDAEELRMQLQRADLQRHHAMEINDNIVQGLVLAKFSLELGEAEQAERAIKRTLASAQAIMSRLLEGTGESGRLEPGSLRRDRPAGFEDGE
jgi:PAS domain S-box-containing protein